jgi:hypothetical protein
MCVRDEADLLPQVLPHVRSLVDHLYVYEDASRDDTWSLVKNEHYATQQQPDRMDRHRGNYRHLFNQIKKDFPNEEVWVVITMGDRFFLNSTPRQIVEDARTGGFEAVEGVQLDFLRHRMDPWTEANDPYPHYSHIRTLARWFKFDERMIIAYKITPQLSYDSAKYPWPQGIQKVQYKWRDMDGELSLDMPYLEHQGRRTPAAAMDRYTSGSRKISKKYKYDLSSYKSTCESMNNFYGHYRIFPYFDTSSLEPFVDFYNSPANTNRPLNRSFFRGMEALSKMIELPPRRDL